MSCAENIVYLIFQILFCFVDDNVLFTMNVIAFYTILTGNQIKFINLNWKEFQNSAKINTEFRVITKPPPTEPAIYILKY